jgi:hypothetical protein
VSELSPVPDNPSIVPEICDAHVDYFTPEARALCARVRHKCDLTDDETVMLALVATQARLAKYIHPGERSAEEALDDIGRILDHDDIVAAIRRKALMDDAKARGLPLV